MRRAQQYNRSPTRRANSPDELEQVIEAQHRLRAKNYENYDHIADKYSKYLDFGGQRDYASMKLGDSTSNNDYRA